MNPNIKIPINAAAEADTPGGNLPSTIVTPTITHYQRVGAEFMQQMQTLIATLPPLQSPHPSTLPFVRSHLTIPLPFLATAVLAVEQSPMLLALGKLDPVAARNALQQYEALRPVLDFAAAFVRDLRFTLDWQRSSLCDSSLQIYDVVKALSRDAASGPMQAIAVNLKRDLGRKGTPQRTATPASARRTDEPATPRG